MLLVGALLDPRGLATRDLPGVKIAIPGTLTTAFLTLQMLFGSLHARNRLVYEVVPFDQIIPAVLAGKYAAGLIIHEGQLTFRAQGLTLVADLGVWWQDKTGLPLPLGGNVVRKDLGTPTMAEISRRSVTSFGRTWLSIIAVRAASRSTNSPCSAAQVAPGLIRES